MDIMIDKNNMNTKPNYRYRGIGMVSANNSSRLLLDYRDENFDDYVRIMEYMFSPKGLNISHLKIEMGSDINSSSGTEPAIMRYESEKADVRRGAGFAIARDAKKINPDLTLDMLWWSEPAWISDSDDVYAARYKWYKTNLDCAFEVYGLKFDYVSANQNERYIDCEWIKYLSNALKNETDCPYDYSKIKIVAGDEVCTWNIADSMLADSELMSSVDVVGSHYTSSSTENAKLLASAYGKELWFSEASSPMSYMQGFFGNDLSGINGVLDIASRIAAMYSCGNMTLCQLQPVISSYYDGTTYCCKQLISACDPWSGFYHLDSGFYMALHFSLFFRKNWAFVDNACFCDAKVGGDGHALVDGKYCYMTACDESSGDYSIVIVNTTDKCIDYNFKVKGLRKSNIYVWETRGSDSGNYDENYFKNAGSIMPCADEGSTFVFSLKVKSGSIITLSTLDIGIDKDYFKNCDIGLRKVLSLPYTDDYEYSCYCSDYLSSRGFSPRFSTDMGGAFEAVTGCDGNSFIMQKITARTKAKEWGWTPDPVTSMGDDRWSNYSVSAKVKFDINADMVSNYVGVGLRYNLSDIGYSGYWLQLFANGVWCLKKCDITIQSGRLDNLDTSRWIQLKLCAFENTFKAYINGKMAVSYISNGESVICSGRAAYFSSYNQNCFDDLVIESIDNKPYYISRYDNTDPIFEYKGLWKHEKMSSFKNYKRTISSGVNGDSFTVKFSGTSIALCGVNDDTAEISVAIDGKIFCESYIVPKSSYREAFFIVNGLDMREHVLELEILNGNLNIDAAEIGN